MAAPVVVVAMSVDTAVLEPVGAGRLVGLEAAMEDLAEAAGLEVRVATAATVDWAAEVVALVQHPAQAAQRACSFTTDRTQHDQSIRTKRHRDRHCAC